MTGGGHHARDRGELTQDCRLIGGIDAIASSTDAQAAQQNAALVAQSAAAAASLSGLARRRVEAIGVLRLDREAVRQFRPAGR